MRDCSYTVGVIIPFRDRGIDPLRQQNLDVVHSYWMAWRPDFGPITVHDGRTGDAQFNRSAAYNRGINMLPKADVFIFAEADMLLSMGQVDRAVVMAHQQVGMVVPFTTYRHMSPRSSVSIRRGTAPDLLHSQWEMKCGRSIGAINVVSRHTLNLIGGRFDERFEGNWYDDDAMKIAFEMSTMPTRFVEGPAHHLYHLPGHRGSHLTTEDEQATTNNRLRLRKYQLADSPGRIRELTNGWD